VVIVGAGAGGLAAARALRSDGRDVVVLEARDRVGGRLCSVNDGSRGIDLGATWFWANETRVQALIDELGLAVHAQHLDGDALYQDPSGVHRLQGNPVDGPAGRLVPGLQALAEAMADTLRHGTVRTGHAVARVRRNDSGLLVEGPFGSMAARQVVLALPPALAVSGIDFEPGLPEALSRLAGRTPVWMGAMTKVVVRYETAFWRSIGLAGAVLSHVGPMREVHDMSGPGGQPAALFGFVPPVVAGAPTVDRDAVLAQLAALFGASAPEPKDVLIQDWRAERFTSPPEAETLQSYEAYGHPLFQTPTMDGRLHWASTETAREFPGHVEGALSAGARAAAAVGKALDAEGASP
jgi:monoamine oxidase